jgi:deoxyadenosine/deoxycytidine kinase
MIPMLNPDNQGARPLVINLLSGPGSGKSTLAAMIFGELKRMGTPYTVELAVEFAKELVWEGRHDALSNQIYVLGEQFQRIERVAGKCDIIVTDSPVCFSAIYMPRNYPASLQDLALWCFRQYPSLNVFVERPAGYESVGRIETRAQAEEIDRRVLEFLETHDIRPVHRVQSTLEDARHVAEKAIAWLDSHGGPLAGRPGAAA